jgi:hypothetical protein
LIIGISANIKYYTFTLYCPNFWLTGAAMSNIIGSIIGFAVSIAIAKKLECKYFRKILFYINYLTVLVYFLSYLGINYTRGIFAPLIVSHILFLKLQILTRSDIIDSLRILPVSISNPIINVLNTLRKKLTLSSHWNVQLYIWGSYLNHHHLIKPWPIF